MYNMLIKLINLKIFAIICKLKILFEHFKKCSDTNMYENQKFCLNLVINFCGSQIFENNVWS